MIRVMTTNETTLDQFMYLKNSMSYAPYNIEQKANNMDSSDVKRVSPRNSDSKCDKGIMFLFNNEVVFEIVSRSYFPMFI